MAEIRRNQRLVESVDPETGRTIYRDEVTGEVVVPDGTTETTEHIVPQGTYVTEQSRTVTPSSEQVVTQRTVSGPVVPQPGAMHTQESQVYTEDPYAHRRYLAHKIQQAIYLIFGIIEGLLAIRFVLRLLGANPNSGFASAIYAITAPFMAPFNGLFGQPAAGGNVVELNTIVAIVVYALIAWVLAKLVGLVVGDNRSGTRTSRVNTRIDQ